VRLKVSLPSELVASHYPKGRFSRNISNTHIWEAAPFKASHRFQRLAIYFACSILPTYASHACLREIQHNQKTLTPAGIVLTTVHINIRPPRIWQHQPQEVPLQVPLHPQKPGMAPNAAHPSPTCVDVCSSVPNHDQTSAKQSLASLHKTVIVCCIVLPTSHRARVPEAPPPPHPPASSELRGLFSVDLQPTSSVKRQTWEGFRVKEAGWSCHRGRSFLV